MENDSQPAESPKKLVRITSLVGASPCCDYPVFSHQTESFTATGERQDSTNDCLVNILQKKQVAHEKEVLHIFGHYAEGKPISVWASNTLPWDLNIPMTRSPPPLPDFLQAFVICVGRPPLLLSLYDKGEYSADVEDYARETARLLHWSLLGFCHLDFQVLPCCMTFEELQSVTDLESVVNKEMNVVERYFKSPLLLSEFTFSKLKETTTSLVGSTFVPCLLEHEQNTKMWMLMMDKEWTDKMSLLMESLHKGDGHYKPLNFSSDERKDDLIIALEAAKRISFSGEVKIQCTSHSVCRCLKRLMDHIKEDFNVSLQLTVNHMTLTGNEGREMLQLKTTATELQLKMQRTFDLIVDGQLPQLCQYQLLEDKAFLEKFTKFYDSNQEQNNGVLHAGDNEYDLPLLYWSAVHSSTELTKWCLKTMGEKAIETRDLAELESLLCAAIAAILFAPTESDVRVQAKCLLSKLIDTEPKFKESRNSKLTLPLPRQIFSEAKVSDLRTGFQSGALCCLDDPSLPIPTTLLSVTVTEDAVSVELPSQHWYLALRLLADRKVDETDRDGNTLLHIAADKGNLEAITLAVKSGACLTKTNNKGLTPYQLAQRRREKDKIETDIDNMRLNLNSAIRDGNEVTVKTLLCCGSSIHDNVTNGSTHLSLACEHGQGRIADLLIDLGADVNVQAPSLRGGPQPLHHACRNGLVETTELLVKHKAKINARNNREETALHCACQCESPTARTDITRLLLDAGADVNARDKRGITPLHYASRHGNTETVTLLIDHRADVHALEKEGNTPLHEASRREHTDTVTLLIDRGADVNAQDQFGNTLLHVAAISGQKETIMLLIDCGAEVNAKNCLGISALHYAVHEDHTQIVTLLIERGADVNAQDKDGSTPLHEALPGSHTDTLKLLIDHGVDLNVPASRGRTFLHKVSRSGHKETLTLLIDGGADLNAMDEDGSTSLNDAYMTNRPDIITKLVEAGAETGRVHQAVVRGDVDALMTLLQQGADVNQHDTSMGCSPLHAACLMGRTDIVTWLTQHGADVDAVDCMVKTPLHCACETGATDIVTRIIQEEPEVNAVDCMDRTPLHCACKIGNADIVTCLIINGAQVNARDIKEQTPLHCAAYELGATDVFTCLIQHEAKVNAVDSMGRTPLHYVCETLTGTSDSVSCLIQHGAEANAVDWPKRTPLHYAQSRDAIEIVACLYEHLAKRQ